jgi:hypothetical protein
VEEVVRLLADGFVERGHDVTLYRRHQPYAARRRVGDEHEMASAIGRLGEIDRVACRERAERDFGVEAALDGYEAVYERAAARGRRKRRGLRRGGTDRQPSSPPPRARHASAAEVR